MSEYGSFSEAVKDSAGCTSLTEAVKDAAGRREWLLEEASESEPESDALAARAGRFCLGLAVLILLLVAFPGTERATVETERPVSAAERDSAAPSRKHVALVIGNSSYRFTTKLVNPRNDAAGISALLKRLGYVVIEGFDLDKSAFEAKMRAFGDELRGAEVGIFFYAGHGLSVAGQNYLVPIDARLVSAAALDLQMVRLDAIQSAMERATKTNILFFDACRDNPLARTLAEAMGTRSLDVGRGLAPTTGSVGTLISFSTQPGHVALDGKGRNSPFSGALLHHLATPGEDLSAILIAVRNDVMKETESRQVPWEHSALTGRFYLNPAKPPPAAATPVEIKLSEAAEAWTIVRDTKDTAVLEIFEARFKDTFYAALARAQVEKLRTPPMP